MSVEGWVAVGFGLLMIGRIGGEVLGNRITRARGRKAARRELEQLATPDLIERIVHHEYFDLTAPGGSIRDTQTATEFFAMIREGRYAELLPQLDSWLSRFSQAEREFGVPVPREIFDQGRDWDLRTGIEILAQREVPSPTVQSSK